MLTYSQLESFYTSGYLKVNTNRLNATGSSLKFCQQSNTTVNNNYNFRTELLGDINKQNNSTDHFDEYDTLRYIFGVSFNWYPFIGLINCGVTLLVLSVIRFSFQKMFSKCFAEKKY